jgi:hypothetical protein
MPIKVIAWQYGKSQTEYLHKLWIIDIVGEKTKNQIQFCVNEIGTPHMLRGIFTFVLGLSKEDKNHK